MADYYWTKQTNNGTGNWSNINMWASSTGGVGGTGAVPTSGDNAHFDSNSFAAAGQVVTIDAAASCQDMNWTGVTNTPNLAITGGNLSFYGNIILTSITTSSSSGYGLLYKGTGSNTLKTNGVSFDYLTMLYTAGTLTLQDNLTMNSGGTANGHEAITLNWHTGGVFDTGGYTINLNGAYFLVNGDPGTLTLGASTITCAKWSITTPNTVSANTSTINCSGDFAGGGITTYNIVNLTGATCSYSGNNTFSKIALVSTTTQTITFASGATITCNTAANIVLSGDATHQHTLTGAANWSISCSSGTISVSYVTLVYSTGTGGATWNSYTANGCVDGGNNYNWNFAAPSVLSAVPLGFIHGR